MTTAVPPHLESAILGDVAGHPVVLRYGDPAAEYAALRSGAVLVDRSHRHRSRITGPRAAEMLTGLVTNDVTALAPGQGQYAAALTPKGKIVADLRILVRPEGVILMDTGARAGDGWMSILRKYVNPRVAPYKDATADFAVLGVYGAHARRVVAQATGVASDALATLAPYAQLAADLPAGPALVVRAPDLGVEGYDLWLVPGTAAEVWRALERSGATPAVLEAWEVARIEAGRPEWGVDIDDSTIPQEANFDELHAISYTKGCYTGQETVARVHFRGHVNRHLRGLRYAHPEPLPTKTQLFDDDSKLVGEVRSAAISPRAGGVALAMVRREIAAESVLRARWETAQGSVVVPVTVTPLPI